MSVDDFARAYLQGEDVRGRRAADALLLPAEHAFRAVAAARRALYRWGALRTVVPPVPVVSVGNLLVGGAGKTPVAALLVRLLLGLGARPALVHGGYAQDEPALHRRWNPEAPVYGNRKRAAAVREAAAAGADVVVLDDGFQHLALARAVNLVLIPADRWDPRPRLLPRGPWREGPRALARADLVAVTHRGAPEEERERVRAEVRGFASGPVAEILLEAIGWRRFGQTEDAPPPGRAVAVTAIADPDGFLRSARAAGVELLDEIRYGDHHAYGADDVSRIARVAGGAPVVTTEKDAVKLEPLAGSLPIYVLRERARVTSGGEELRALLRRVLR